MMTIKTANTCIACHASENLLKTKPAFLMPFVAYRIFGWEPFEIDASLGYRDINSGWAYPLCKSIACSNCGIIFCDIRFTNEQMDALYEGYREKEYVSQRQKFECNYSEKEIEPLDYINEKEKFIRKNLTLDSGKMILDWGGDTGQSVVFNDGINELFSYDVGKLRPLKAGIKHFDLESKITFDLITCSHVLEHVPFPIEFVADLKKHIKPDGIIFFELPLERIMEPAKNHSIEERLNSKHHWHEHINFFSLESLRHIFKNAGFKVLNLEFVDVNAPGNFDRVIMANLCSLKT